MKICCVFSLELPHWGYSDKYTQYTTFDIYKKNNKKTLNYPKYAALGFFQETQERVRSSRGKQAISDRATEGLLYFHKLLCQQKSGKIKGWKGENDSLYATETPFTVEKMPISSWIWAWNDNLAGQGPVVQSIVSLTSSLRGYHVQCFTTEPNTLIFLLKTCEKLLHCKSFSYFFNKKYWHICEINVLNFKEMLTNDVISFEQPGPVLLTSYVNTQHSARINLSQIFCIYKSDFVSETPLIHTDTVPLLKAIDSSHQDRFPLLVHRWTVLSSCLQTLLR